MGSPKTAQELLDMYFLDARSQLLEAAAIMDRIERAHGGENVLNDGRLKQLRDACGIIKNGKGNRVEQFLLLMSEPEKE